MFVYIGIRNKMGKVAEKVVIKTRWPVLGQWFLSMGKGRQRFQKKKCSL